MSYLKHTSQIQKAAFSTADAFFTNVVKNLFDGVRDSWSKYTLFQILVE
jgi:hypothetical protein